MLIVNASDMPEIISGVNFENLFATSRAIFPRIDLACIKRAEIFTLFHPPPPRYKIPPRNLRKKAFRYAPLPPTYIRYRYRPFYRPSYSLFKARSEEHTSELQSRLDLVCRLLLEKKNTSITTITSTITP